MKCCGCGGEALATIESEAGIRLPHCLDTTCAPVIERCKLCREETTNVADNFYDCGKHFVLRSCNSVEYYTPPDVVNDVHEMWNGIQLDPATAEHNPTRAKRVYTKDGHKLPWMDCTFCNPPYGRQLVTFIKHAWTQAANRYRIAMLLPCGPRFSTKAFQSYVFTEYLTAMVVFNRRLQFSSERGNPFDSILYLYNCSRREANSWSRQGKVLHVQTG